MSWSKRVLRSFVWSILPHSMLGGKQSMAACIGEQGHGPRQADLLSLVFRYAFTFHSHYTLHKHRGPSPHSPPLPLLLHFNVNGRMNGCSWPIKRPALLKGPGDWDSVRPRHLYPPPCNILSQHPHPSVSVLLLIPTINRTTGGESVPKGNWWGRLPLKITMVSM